MTSSDFSPQAGTGEPVASVPADSPPLVDLIDVGRVLRKLARLNDELDRLHRHAEAEHSQIVTWEEAETVPLANEVLRLRGALMAFAEARCLEDGTRTTSTPWGRITLTVPEQPAARIADKAALTEWAKANAPELVTTTETVTHANVKKLLTVTDGAVIHAPTGEVVPGVEASVPAPRLSVKTDPFDDLAEAI